MPPVIIWAIGALGTVALARVLAGAARRANSELDDIRRNSGIERPIEKLERDPESGDYRPRNS